MIVDDSDKFLGNLARTRWVWRVWTGVAHQTLSIHCPNKNSMARHEIWTQLMHCQLDELHNPPFWGLCGCRWTQSWVVKPLVCSFPNSWGTSGCGKNVEKLGPGQNGVGVSMARATSSGNLEESHKNRVYSKKSAPDSKPHLIISTLL